MKPIIFLILTGIGSLMFQNKEMQVYQGQTFQVVLEANHSTGYLWQWENKSRQSIIDSVHADYILSSKTLTGAGGNEIWEFKAKKPGEEQLIMVYKRPWEKEGDFKRKEILVRVIPSEQN